MLAGRRIWVIDTAAPGGRDCGACGGRQLIAEPLGRPESRRSCVPDMSTAANSKERILEALGSLPQDSTVDGAIERLVFMARVEEGLAQLDADQGIHHEAVKRRFGATSPKPPLSSMLLECSPISRSSAHRGLTRRCSWHRTARPSRFETLRGELGGSHSIRVNDQCRIVLRWSEGAANAVRLADHHKG